MFCYIAEFIKGEEMKMEISKWANINNMTPEEFKNEIAATMAVIGGMELDKNEGEENTVVFTVEDKEYKYKVCVHRVAI